MCVIRPADTGAAGVAVGVAYGIWGAINRPAAVLGAALFPTTHLGPRGHRADRRGATRRTRFAPERTARHNTMWLTLLGDRGRGVRHAGAAGVRRASQKAWIAPRDRLPGVIPLLWLTWDSDAVGIASVWTACGVACVAMIARYLFNDPLTWKMMAGIGLIVAGSRSSWRASSLRAPASNTRHQSHDRNDEQPNPKTGRVGNDMTISDIRTRPAHHVTMVARCQDASREPDQHRAWPPGSGGAAGRRGDPATVVGTRKRQHGAIDRDHHSACAGRALRAGLPG
jgi:small multidrug resistance pump